MAFLVNMIILVFVLFVFSTQIDTYNKIIFSKYRFQYFALRDRLALLVVNGKLEENSWEYRKIVGTINFHINTLETVSIHKIISFLAQYHSSPEEGRRVKIIKKKLDHPEVIEILAEFMDLTGRLLERNSGMQLRFFRSSSKTDESRKHAEDMQPIEKHKVALDRVQSYRDELRNSLGNKLALA